jgi:heterodisulfide reductase subunit C/nitrate reductase gamma subunit
MTMTAIIAYGCLAIGLGGVLWRLGRWFWIPVGPEGCGRPLGTVLRQTGAAIGHTFISRKIVALARKTIWEILLQGHVLKQDWRRGVTHLALCYGVLFLVVFHALDDFTSTRLWADYAPTLNPWRFLRNLGGALVILGAVMAARRRQSAPLLRRTRTAADRLGLALLAAMVLSGFLLESGQIVSPGIFDTMVADYLIGDDDQEIAALQAYWQADFGTAARQLSAAADATMLARGRELHLGFCADCHDRPRSAFVSYPLSMLLRPVANTLAGVGFATILWHVHFLTVCLGLALLPFTKFFHLVAAPLSLLARAAGPAAASPVNLRPVRRALGLDACTHCGVCSQHCAVAVIYRANPNPTILPSEKLGAVKRWVSGACEGAASAALAEGSFICTACGRCTAWCPSGIDLQDLWQALRDDLVRQGFPPACGWIRSRRAAQWAADLPAAPPAASEPPVKLGISENPATFWACVQCTTCTSVCPVVAVSDDPRRDLDLTPQQVMNLMRLQLRELALGARMVWDCVTCYQCQEHCPQGVQVADILYELRNEAHRRLQPGFPVRPVNAGFPED